MKEKEFPKLPNKPFYVKVNEAFFEKECVLKTFNCQEVEVLKVYRNTWWRRFLLWLGFKVRVFEVKVISKTT